MGRWEPFHLLINVLEALSGKSNSLEEAGAVIFAVVLSILSCVPIPKLRFLSKI